MGCWTESDQKKKKTRGGGGGNRRSSGQQGKKVHIQKVANRER